MSGFKKMKFWIGDDPRLSERVQNTLSELGYRWTGSLNRVGSIEYTALYTNSGGYIIGIDGDRLFFDNHECPSINIDWMRTPKKKETIELNGKKYLKEDLEEALKHMDLGSSRGILPLKPIGE